MTFDFYPQLKSRPIPEAAKKPVIIVELDERRLAEVDPRPGLRTTIAQRVEGILRRTYLVRRDRAGAVELPLVPIGGGSTSALLSLRRCSSMDY